MSRFHVVAGVFVRRHLRRYLQANSIQFVEDKGLVDSQFVIDTNAQHQSVILGWVKRLGEHEPASKHGIG